MKPMATYEEKCAGNQWAYELFPDRIQIRGAALFRGRYEYSVPLDGLDPNLMRRWARGSLFAVGLYLVVLFAILDGIIGPSLWSSNKLVFLVLTVPIPVGAWMTLATIRPVEKTWFRSFSGHYSFGIGRCGPQTNQYDSFVAAVVAAIEANRASAAQPVVSVSAPRGAATPTP